MNEDTAGRVAMLLHQAGETHHIVFADTDGNDDDWATFYSDWLLTHSDLHKLLGRRPVRSHLTSDFVVFDAEYTKTAPSQPWPAWYASRLMAKYGSP